jgi:hypothetical protein
LRLIIASASSLAYLLPLSSLIASEPLAKDIQDNSFFIEEAYNQEPGVVQHIFNLPIDFTNSSREIAPSFTQEWPVFSQTPPVLNTHGNRHLTNYNVGASTIYAVSRDFNLTLETLACWNEDIAEGVFAFEEAVERSATAIIPPGLALRLQLA